MTAYKLKAARNGTLGSGLVARAAVQPHKLTLQRKLASPVAGLPRGADPALKKLLRLLKMSAVLQPVKLLYDIGNINGCCTRLCIGKTYVLRCVKAANGV